MNDQVAKTIRPLSSSIAFWALCALGAFLLGDAVLRGSWELVLRSAGVIGFGLWCAWILLFRVSLRVEAAGLRVVNPLRISWLPWGRISAIGRRLQILIELDDGTRVECWGSPLPRRAALRGTFSRAGRGGDEPRNEDPALEWLAYAHASAAHSGGEIRRGWDVPAVVSGGILLLWAAVGLLAP